MPGEEPSRGGATRAELVRVARELFAERGYAGVGTEEIVRRARVTRGALYHHFADKQALFRAVFEDLERELVEELGGRILAIEDPWELLAAGIREFLALSTEQAVARISLIDAPAVLGWEEWREIDARYALAQTEAGLRALVEAGLLEDRPVEPLARLLHGASVEAALYVASSEDPGKAKEEVRDAMGRLLGALRWVPGKDRR